MGPFFYTIVVCSSYCNRIPHSLNTHTKKWTDTCTISWNTLCI